ncbi:unnamed protein product [Parnassius mnemosyne]|uniref:Endonuclease-reverse transcriptase n=1 Tax=Parnassius mnemosyne TaxID=213953 RepID=A0AAV1LN15_9NEOP
MGLEPESANALTTTISTNSVQNVNRNKILIGVLRWFGHVERMSEDRMVKKIYRAKVNIKRCRGRPRLTLEDHVSKLLEEGRVKSTRILRRACMKKIMNLKEAKEVCKDRDTWRSVLSGYPVRDCA